MKKVIRPYSLGLSICLSLVGCGNERASAETAPPSTMQTSKVTAPPTSAVRPATLRKDDLRIFEVNGSRIINFQIGDLNGDGQLDALVVLNQPTSDRASGAGSGRRVILAITDATGRLHQAAQNSKIVPCEDCGGIAGDPFGYSRIDKDGFTLLTEGGSRERWWNEYTFKYAADAKNWTLAKVRRGVSDTATEKRHEVTLTPKNYGLVTFEDLDPSRFPEVRLP